MIHALDKTLEFRDQSVYLPNFFNRLVPPIKLRESTLARKRIREPLANPTPVAQAL